MLNHAMQIAPGIDIYTLAPLYLQCNAAAFVLCIAALVLLSVAWVRGGDKHPIHRYIIICLALMAFGGVLIYGCETISCLADPVHTLATHIILEGGL